MNNQTVSLEYEQPPVHVSPSLHVVQRGHHHAEARVEGVAVDALSSRAHLVELSFHLQLGVDVTRGFCCCGALRFLEHKEELSVSVWLCEAIENRLIDGGGAVFTCM